MNSSGYLLCGFKLILLPGLRRFVILPLLINTLVFTALIWSGVSQFNHLLTWLLSFLPSWRCWLEWLLWPLFVLLLLVVAFFSFSLVVNLIGAPFNGLLAEAVEQHLTGRNPAPQTWASFMKQLIPALFDELRKILYFLLWSIPFLLLFLIPVINIVAPFVWMAFSAWVLALQYLDYPMGNHGLSFSLQRQTLQKKRLAALSFGGATLVATLIPVVNFLVMPAAVAGATALWLEVFADNPS